MYDDLKKDIYIYIYTLLSYCNDLPLEVLLECLVSVRQVVAFLGQRTSRLSFRKSSHPLHMKHWIPEVPENEVEMLILSEAVCY